MDPAQENGGWLSADVHWHEGQFLRPHHLQVLQRSFRLGLREERFRAKPFPWGVIDVAVNAELLARGTLRFEHLHAVTRSGVVVRAPEQFFIPDRDLVESLQGRSGLQSVGLGVPLWHARRRNVADTREEAERARYPFHVTECAVMDENVGDDEQHIHLRLGNAYAILEGESTEGMEFFPLLQLKIEAESDQPRFSESLRFVPACLTLGGSRELTRLVENLAHHVEMVRKDRAADLQRQGYSPSKLQGAAVADMLRLLVIATGSADLSAICGVREVHPFDVFQLLHRFVAGLESLSPAEGFRTYSYDHSSPHDVFVELDQRIRELLSHRARANFIELDFNDDGRALRLPLEEEHLVDVVDYYLCVESPESAQRLTQLVTGPQFKLGPSRYENSLVRGFSLSYVPTAPPGLPSGVGREYFQVGRASERDRELWKHMKEDRELVMQWGRLEFERQRVSLIMMLPTFVGQR